ncbi:MAG: helix-turn-helix transcriptional regulator [Chitinophagaceae bacterium]|nr:helix-turn-helix transcriptional regulator [Anaerolineae bacterium]
MPTPTSPKPSIPQPEPELLISDIEALKAYFDPMRIRILRTVSHQPRSVHEIAAELEIPFTRLYYHINMLEKYGLIRLVETRNFSGAVEEKYYQVMAHVFVVDKRLMTLGPTDNQSESGLEIVLRTVLDDTRRDIENSLRDGRIEIMTKAPDPQSLLIRRGLSALSKERAQTFYERLLDLLKDFAVDDPEGGDFYALSFALYPSSYPYTAADEPPE